MTVLFICSVIYQVGRVFDCMLMNKTSIAV